MRLEASTPVTDPHGFCIACAEHSTSDETDGDCCLEDSKGVAALKSVSTPASTDPWQVASTRAHFGPSIRRVEFLRWQMCGACRCRRGEVRSPAILPAGSLGSVEVSTLRRCRGSGSGFDSEAADDWAVLRSPASASEKSRDTTESRHLHASSRRRARRVEPCENSRRKRQAREARGRVVRALRNDSRGAWASRGCPGYRLCVRGIYAMASG